MAQTEKDIYTIAEEKISKLSPDEVKAVLAYVETFRKSNDEVDPTTSIPIFSAEEVQQMINPAPSKLMGEELIDYREQTGAIGMLEIDPDVDSVTWLKQQRAKRASKFSW